MEKEKKQVALFSVVAAFLLTGSKLIIGLLTGSLGILSEALHSALDMVAAVITYFSVRISDKPADKEHNYGHGKVENLSALIETILLLITCAWIIFEAIDRLVNGRTLIEVSVWSYVVVIGSILVDVTRSKALYKVAKKTNSQALEADALHFSTDIWSSTVVLLGLICAQFGWHLADPIAALFVAFIVLFVSYRLGKRSIDVLLDKAPSQVATSVEEALSEFSEVRYFHSLKIRTSGADTFIKVNIHVNPEASVKEVHELCDRIESKLNARIPRSEVFIHVEPLEAEQCEHENA